MKLRHLILGTGNDQLAEAAMGDAALLAIGIKGAATCNAGLRFKAGFWIIYPRMDHFAITGGGAHANAVFSLDDDDFPSGQRLFSCYRKTDNSCANDNTLYHFHGNHPFRTQLSALKA